MSVSPKYRSNFSVTDILSPLDETAAVALHQRPLKPYSTSDDVDSPSSGEQQEQQQQANADSYLLLNSVAQHATDNNNKSMSVPVSTPFHQLGMHGSHPASSTPHSGGSHTPAASSAFSTAGSQYVNGATELSSAYGVSTDVRAPTAPWYSTSTADPRFATDYTLSTGKVL